MRDHWRELDFWRWWWHERVSGVAKALLAVLLLGGIVVGGWFAATRLPSAKASDSGTRTIIRTVEHVITVQTQGKVVVKRVPVIRKVYVANKAAAPTTVRVAQTVVRTIETPAIRSRSETVTLPAHTRTVTKTRTITTTKTVPVTTVQWRVITVVEKQPVTVTVTVTTP